MMCIDILMIQKRRITVWPTEISVQRWDKGCFSKIYG